MISKRLIFVFIFSLSWALFIFFGKLALRAGDPPMASTLQLLIISNILLFLICLPNIKKITKISLRQFWILALIGICIGIATLLNYYGLRLSTSINYSFLTQSLMIYGCVLAVIFLKEKWDWKKTLLIISFLIGAYLITAQGSLIIPHTGDILILIGALFLAFNSIIQKPLLTAGLDAGIISLYRSIFATLAILIIFPFIIKDFHIFQGGIYILLAGISYAFMTLFLSKTLAVASVQYQALMSNIMPVIVVVLGVVFLGENFSIFHAIGGGLIILSSIFVLKLKI